MFPVVRFEPADQVSNQPGPDRLNKASNTTKRFHNNEIYIDLKNVKNNRKVF